MDLLLLGCGNIGNLLLKTLISSESFRKIVVVQPSMSWANHYVDYPLVHFVCSIDNIPSNFKPHITILAIKPQILHQIVPKLNKPIAESIIVSLLAGVSIATIKGYMMPQTEIIRVMPNVAIATKQSINLSFAENTISADIRNYITQIFTLSGQVIWLQDEKFIDILTPICGSGPAYFFLLAEILTQAACKMGIDQDIARDLTKQILVGSASLLSQQQDYIQLINLVSSKGGVTETALTIMRPAFHEALQDALQACFKKLVELSK